MLRLRILFAWILMAALPMQGFAAASMLFCGMGAQHQHTAEASAPHDHAAMHGHTTSVEQGHAQAADLTPGASTDTGHKCSICAACCNGVAIVGVNYVVAMAPAPQVELAEPFVLIHALPSPVPDKPPRA